VRGHSSGIMTHVPSLLGRQQKNVSRKTYSHARIAGPSSSGLHTFLWTKTAHNKDHDHRLQTQHYSILYRKNCTAKIKCYKL